jgi:hypothetical protein
MWNKRLQKVENFEQFGRSRSDFSNTKYWNWCEIKGCQRWKIISRGPGAEPRKMLSKYLDWSRRMRLELAAEAEGSEDCRLRNLYHVTKLPRCLCYTLSGFIAKKSPLAFVGARALNHNESRKWSNKLSIYTIARVVWVCPSVRVGYLRSKILFFWEMVSIWFFFHGVGMTSKLILK